jgi:CRP-like cAMP-binding protein
MLPCREYIVTGVLPGTGKVCPSQSNNQQLPMNLERLFEVLSAMQPLSDSFKVALEKEMVHLSLPKDYFLLEAPKVSEHAYFIAEGFAMSYTFIKGKKQIERFFASGQIIVSPKSFFEQTATDEFIQLMEQSDVLHIHYSAVLQLLQNFPEANAIYRMVMNQYLEQFRERVHDMQHLSALERFKKLRKHFPGIEQVVPQEYLASYLGIAPQSLSRLKRTR